MKLTAKLVEGRKMVTGLVRIGFAWVVEPREPDAEALKKNPKAEPKYKCMIVFPKGSDTESVLKDLMRTVAEDKWGKKLPTGWHKGLRDGDKDDSLDFDSEDDQMLERIEVLKGMRFCNASTTFKPDVLGRVGPDGKREELTRSQIKSGDYVQMSINCFAFETDGNKAVGFGFDTIILKRVGDPCLGGGSGPSKTDLGAFDDDDELPKENDEDDEGF